MTDHIATLERMENAIHTLLLIGDRPLETAPEDVQAEVEALRAAIALMRGQSWRSLLDSPEKSGRYVVCHRGGVAGHAFYVHPSDSPIGNLTAGWNQMPDFRPTHWTAPVDIGLRESNQLRRALDPAPPKDPADEQ